MSDCIFCKIIQGVLPKYKVYEDEDVVAFLDIHPVSVGHTLVVPKKHYLDLVNAPPEVAANLMAITQKIAPSIMEAVGATAFNLALNNGAQAGQVVNHVHLHIIPRFADDGLRLWPAKEVKPTELEDTVKKIRTLVV
ncbi:TPA: hypothetical protein DEB72_02580 [Patescibacteria group bacterium]|nr:hypothetical protein [Patescibacteria group bacterium]